MWTGVSTPHQLRVRRLGELGVDAQLGPLPPHGRGRVHPGGGPALDRVGDVDVVVQVRHHDVPHRTERLDLVGEQIVDRHHRVEPERAVRAGGSPSSASRGEGRGSGGRGDASTAPRRAGRARSSAEVPDRRLEDLLAADELGDRHVLAGLVGDLDVSRAEDDRARAERGHLRRLGAEAHRGRAPGRSRPRGTAPPRPMAGVSTPRSVRRMRMRTSQPGSSRRSWNISCSMA